MDSKVIDKRLLEPHDIRTEPVFPEQTSLLENSGPNNQSQLQTELEAKLRHTGPSEGYETMTQHSSDIVSEVKHI